MSQVKTARIKKSAKEQNKNEGNKHKSKNIKGNNKINKDDPLGAMEVMTKMEDFPQFAWLDWWGSGSIHYQLCDMTLSIQISLCTLTKNIASGNNGVQAWCVTPYTGHHLDISKCSHKDTGCWPLGHTFGLNLFLELEPSVLDTVLLITSGNVKSSNHSEFFNINCSLFYKCEVHFL